MRIARNRYLSGSFGISLSFPSYHQKFEISSLVKDIANKSVLANDTLHCRVKSHLLPQ